MRLTMIFSRLALVGIAVAMLSCDGRGLTVDDVRQRGFLRAAYSEEPPYAFMDSAGLVTGEAPEALRSAADGLGIDEIRWVRVEFGDLMTALEQGRVDVVAAGLYRTEEREERVRFTRPTVCSGPALVVKGTAPSPRDLGELASDASLRTAVIGGSVEQAALRELGTPDSNLLMVPDVQTGLAAVMQGAAHAFAISAPTARYFVNARTSDGLAVRAYAPPAEVAPLLRGCSALALRPGDRELAEALDSALAVGLSSPRRGEILRSLGFAPQEITGDAESGARR